MNSVPFRRAETWGERLRDHQQPQYFDGQASK